MRREIIFFMLSAFACYHCSEPEKKGRQPKTEVIEHILTHYNGVDTALKNPYWIFRDKVWCYKTMAIEEVRYLSILDSSNVRKEDYRIQSYRFSDFQKDVFYEFRSFSDTASLIGAYSYKDTLPRSGGWMFKRNSHIEYEGDAKEMPDTVVGGVSYKRLKTMSFRKNIPYVTECYFRCDQQGTVFNIDKELSKKTGCPLTKTFSYPPVPTNSALRLDFEIRYLSDTLTKDEQKIFDAWEKFAEENPVKSKG